MPFSVGFVLCRYSVCHSNDASSLEAALTLQHHMQTLRISSGDPVVVKVFRLPKEDFAITVLSAAVSFVTKRVAAGPAMMLDAPEMNAHLQSRFGTQVPPGYTQLCCAVNAVCMGCTICCLLYSLHSIQDSYVFTSMHIVQLYHPSISLQCCPAS